ncbi:MAG: cardiolipin synthase B [Betaproteobacteria bacterium RIFCSPLOWO2_12_FULL_62_58]|nr:MAG: cardiolipin synthase B [Betaproteobacteria bacterium RIFCSPLOWO2_12_FULL_62_58]
MEPLESKRLQPPAVSLARAFAEQAFSRAAGAPLVPGNSVRILKDAAEHYPAWLEAIRSATRTVYFENYIVAEDRIGREFVAALAAKAREGVRVRAMHDWVGALGRASGRLWQPLIEAGGEVRCFNPPRPDSPFGWLTRDHRKMVAVDGEVGFVTGVCVSRKWVGDPARGIEPWRDTGVEVRGPAVADIERAFAEVWAATGAAIPEDELADPEAIAPAGDVMVRVLATVPNIAALYRLDQLIAVMARRTLWLTDAYFVGIAPYVQALSAAALDGVDVRLLVPGTSDLPVLSALSRAGYRPLLEAGIRVFEWNGPMLHAKSAVADGRWARVGSSNLNLSSWIGNYELDVAVEDQQFAAAMKNMYEADLANATEIVLSPRNRVRPATPRRRRRSRGGSASRAAAGALRLGNTVGAAITNRRVLGPAEAGTMIGVGVALLVFAAVTVSWPLLVAVPLALLAAWVAVSFLVRAHELRNAGKRAEEEGRAAPQPAGDAAGDKSSEE